MLVSNLPVVLVIVWIARVHGRFCCDTNLRVGCSPLEVTRCRELWELAAPPGGTKAVVLALFHHLFYQFGRCNLVIWAKSQFSGGSGSKKPWMILQGSSIFG